MRHGTTPFKLVHLVSHKNHTTIELPVHTTTPHLHDSRRVQAKIMKDVPFSPVFPTQTGSDAVTFPTTSRDRPPEAPREQKVRGLVAETRDPHRTQIDQTTRRAVPSPTGRSQGGRSRSLFWQIPSGEEGLLPHGPRRHEGAADAH
jgi:hypothetical protein